MKKAVIAVALGLGIAGIANAQTWIKTAESNTAIFEARAGSAEIVTDEGIKFVQIIERVTLKDNSAPVRLSFVRIPVVHCNRGYGKVFTVSFEEKVLEATDFVFDSGNIASIIAKLACGAVLGENNAKPRKTTNI